MSDLERSGRASAGGRAMSVTAAGHTSVKRSTAFNAKLGKVRAEVVAALLKARVPEFSNFVAISDGAPESSGSDSAGDRRVSLRVTLTPPLGGTSLS